MMSIADLVMKGWNRPNLPGLYQKSYPGSGGVTVGNLYTRTKASSERQRKAREGHSGSVYRDEDLTSLGSDL